MNARLSLTAVALFAASALVGLKAGDEDPIAAQLLKDKEAFAAAQGKAREEVLKAFDKYYETVKNNKALKIESQLAQLEKIEAEKKAFEEGNVLPTLPGLKVAMSEYRASQKRAELACKQAFEKAAKAYRDKGEVKLAGATLEEMREFLAKAPGAAGGDVKAQIVACGVSNKVWGVHNGSADVGATVVTADYVKGDQTMLWRVVPAGDGWSYIENVKSGLVITCNGKGNGEDAVLGKKQAGADSQLWKVTPLPAVKDAVKFVCKLSNKPIGVDGKSKNAGARIRLWDDQGNEPAQYFGFVTPK
ncbi:MAG: RICIN domain-containing protein [Planctomycetes bacterium]|nr:RICIN domain-containing protein [Planctomycetota bacterium]